MGHANPSATPSSEARTEKRQPTREYQPPAVIYEAPLEVRAGTPLGIPNPLDPTGTSSE